MSAPARETWFTASQFEVVPRSEAGGLVGGDQCWIAHAKQMGTNLTACGQNAYTWTKLWHVPFRQSTATRCPACVDALTSRPPAQHRHLADRV